MPQPHPLATATTSCLSHILLPQPHPLALATSSCLSHILLPFLWCQVPYDTSFPQVCHLVPAFVLMNNKHCTVYSTYEVLYSVQYLLSCFHLKGRCCKAFEGKNYENESLGHWHILNDPKTWPVKPLVTPQKPALWSLKTLVSPQKPAVWHLKPSVSPQKPALWPLKPLVSPRKPALWPLKPLVSLQKPAVWPLKPWVTPQKPAVWPLKPLV